MTNISQPLFEINNLVCAYRQTTGKSGNAVLKIPHLTIPAQKIIVLLGKSGAGKSTILETLGLMNNTISPQSNLIFRPDSGTQLAFEKIWENSDIDRVRNRHFSFIFQHTNLMPNFTVYENICITQLLQGTSKADAIKNAQKIMNRIGLGEVDSNKKPHELSGGQRQRVAFVRAITAQFTVLFGDEPTGNLDEINSRELMTILTDNIKSNGRTAIIVTHNIDLALEFADTIIILTKNKEDGIGQVEPANIFNKIDHNWAANGQSLQATQLRGVIENLIR